MAAALIVLSPARLPWEKEPMWGLTPQKNNIHICGGCTIGTGAVVFKHITESGTYVGVPAEKIK